MMRLLLSGRDENGERQVDINNNNNNNNNAARSRLGAKNKNALIP